MAQLCLNTGVSVGAPEPLSEDDSEANSEDGDGIVVPIDRIRSLVALVRDGTPDQKDLAALALANLAHNFANRAAIAREHGIPPLVALVRNGTDLQKEAAARALRYLTTTDDANREAAVAAGGIAPLAALVRGESDTNLKSLASQILFKLVVDNNANKETVAVAGGIP